MAKNTANPAPFLLGREEIVIDTVPFYSSALVPNISISIREFYISTYHDRFFIDPPAWFRMYLLLELVYHLPVSLWMVKALIDGKPPSFLLN
jgi:hypothetical protein